jgi:preprotein translocase subunit Sec61beta
MYPDTVLYMENEKYVCMAKKQGGRLISSAGLVNYYESEDKRAVHISPYAVIVGCAAIGIFVLVLNIIY